MLMKPPHSNIFVDSDANRSGSSAKKRREIGDFTIGTNQPSRRDFCDKKFCGYRANRETGETDVSP
jgi:hypothetical protein